MSNWERGKNDGLCHPNPWREDYQEERARWLAICKESDDRTEEWITRLRAFGVKAAHPNDGWVDRKEHSINFQYPWFNDGAEEGDYIALGDKDEFVVVRVRSVDVKGFFTKRTYYKVRTPAAV